MKKIQLILLLIIANLSLMAQNEFTNLSAQEIMTFKAAMKDKNAQINSLSSPFVQTKTMSILKEPSIMKGVIYFKTSNKFRWEYMHHPKFIFAQSGSNIYTQTGDKVQVVTDNSAKLYEEISKLVQESINGNILENSKDFSASYEQNSKFVKIDLTPKQRGLKRFISSITLYIDKKTMLASKFIMFEANGDATIIEFEKIKTNIPLDDQLFILKK